MIFGAPLDESPDLHCTQLAKTASGWRAARLAGEQRALVNRRQRPRGRQQKMKRPARALSHFLAFFLDSVGCVGDKRCVRRSTTQLEETPTSAITPVPSPRDAWYVFRDGAEIGPFTLNALIHEARSGRLRLTDQIRRYDVSEWSPITRFGFLADWVPQAGAYGARAGIGGWLLLPAIGLVLGPLGTLFLLVGDLWALTGPSEASPRWCFIAETCINFTFCLFELFVAVAFFRRSKWAPALVIALLLVGVVAGAVDSVLVRFAGLQPGAGSLLIDLITAAVWVPYFVFSRRVAATFGAPSRPRWKLASGLVLALAVLSLGLGWFWQPQSNHADNAVVQSPPPVVRAPLSAEAIFAAASPAVVRVEVRDRTFNLIGLGSGFVVSTDGLVATNQHVIQNAYLPLSRFLMARSTPSRVSPRRWRRPTWLCSRYEASSSQFWNWGRMRCPPSALRFTRLATQKA